MQKFHRFEDGQDEKQSSVGEVERLTREAVSRQQKSTKQVDLETIEGPTKVTLYAL